MPHPVVEAIQTGKAPRPARLAAAKGLLPLPPEDLLFALSLLAKDTDEEVRSAVPEALMHFNPEVMLVVAQDQKADPALLTFLCTTPKIPEMVVEAVILNRATPDPAIAKFALTTQSTSLIEALTINQQRLIRNPQLIEAILHNPKRSPEAERRAREVKLEFFEKDFGKERISQEAAAQSKSTQAEAQFTVVAPPKPVAAPPPPPPAPVTAAPPPSVPAQPVAPPAAEAPKPTTAPGKPLKLSASPPVAMIQQGKAPRPAKLMTAMGKLPLAPEDLLHAQVLLATDTDQEIATAARNSIDEKDPDSFLTVAQNREAPEEVLAYLLTWSKLTTGLGEALLINPSIPDTAVINFARMSSNGSLLEAATINQQRLIRIPDLIDAILNNPYRTFEAERRAKEVRVEFFEKELGAARIAQEKKARAEKFAGIVDTPVSDEEFNELLSSFEADVGISLEGVSDEEPSIEDAIAAFNRMLASVKEEDLSEEDREFLLKERQNMSDSDRLSIYQQLAKMTIKERIFAALKGNREVRSILIRDANKLISTGVVKNPKITDAEVEAFANIKGISEDVLRVIAMNRAWISSYNIMHNLVRNPRCPPNFSMNMMPRLQQRDLLNLSKSKGIPDMIRQAAGRLYTKRQAGKG